MTTYTLIDINNAIIREADFDVKPSDPIGKAWKWVETIQVNPVVGADEEVSNTIITFANNQVIKTLTVVSTKAQRSDINDERDRRINKNFTVTLANTSSNVVISGDETSLTNLHRLATLANTLKAANKNLTLTYRDATNANITINADQIIQLYAGMMIHVQGIMEASWLIKDDVTLPTTLKNLRKDPRWP